RPGRHLRRPGGGRDERPAEPADAGPRLDLAVQHRQPLRGVLVRGEPRRRRGDGQLRLHRRHAADPAHVVQAVRDPADELADGRADAGERALLRAYRRPAVPPLGDAAPRLVHDPDRAAAADRSARAPAPGAVLVRHRAQGLRAALAGGCLAGVERDRGRVDGDGSTGPRRPRARPRPPDRARPAPRRLKDGSLFVPAVLLAKHKPFDAVTRSRLGSYWNLVMPYALASGFFAPRGRQAAEILRYMLGHGSRLLGLVRAGAYSLYGGKVRYPITGIDQVYGLAVARFLADNDQA